MAHLGINQLLSLQEGEGEEPQSERFLLRCADDRTPVATVVPEVAAEMGVTENQLQTTLSQISFVGVAALDEMLSGGDRGESVTLGDTVADAC